MSPENERIRGYLQSQAGKHPIDELQRRVQEGVDALHASAGRFDATAFETVPAGDSWSPRDCLSHVVASDMAVARQVLHVALTGELPAYEEQAVSGDAQALLAAHTEAIDSLYAHLEAADPESFLDVRWDHFMFGPLNWREWFLFLRLHCFDHQRQLEGMREALANG